MHETLTNISNMLTNFWNFCSNVWYVITNPSQILIGFLDLSYWILLLTSIVCLMLTLAGCKKTKNGTTISIIIYAILQCLRAILV